MFKKFVDTLNTIIWSTPEGLPWLVVLLLGTGLFLTIRMGFIQFRRLGHAVNIVRGKYDDPDDAGDISHFQALSTALSATVGIGNVAGVAIAIHFGGPGAVFWMWLTALLGMCTKYTEVSLAMRYRDFDAAGNSSGGPHKYILKGLGEKWKPMAVFFAVCAIVSSFGAGNMNQINTLADAVNSSFGVPFWITGVVAAGLVGFVILGGIQRIGKITAILAPSMALLYTTGALIVIFMNIGELGNALGSIVSNAFNPSAGFAGTAAGVWSTTLLWGVKRGLFSNEAGQGSAPIAHAAAKTDVPLREGIVALMEPFIDTLCICTMTAVVVLVSGYWDEPLSDHTGLDHKDILVYTWDGETELTLESFGRGLGRFGGEETIGKANADGKYGKVFLVITEGRLVGLRKDGDAALLSGAALARNDAPILTDGDGPFLVTQGTRAAYSGQIPVENGKFADTDLAKEVTVQGRVVQTGQALTAAAFGKSLGDFGRLIVLLTVVLFALSTAISWSYYGDRCTEFLFGIDGVMIYRFIFLIFVFLGAILPLKVVWDFGDLALGLMTLPNLIAMILLSGKVRKMQDEYEDAGMHK